MQHTRQIRLTPKVNVEVLQAAEVWLGGRRRESLEELFCQTCVVWKSEWERRSSHERGRRTVDEEEVGTGILLSPTGEITDDTVDVGGGGHKEVHRVKTWLCLAVARYRFDD